MNKKLVLIFFLILIFIFFILAVFFGIFQKPAQPDTDDICYGINIEILDCSYSIDTGIAQVNLKLGGGKLERIQGLISGKILGNLAGSEDVVELNWNTPYQKIIEFNFEKTVDGISLDNFEGPFKLQVRPIMEGKSCIQFDTARCESV